MSDTPKQNRNITARACTFALDRIAGWIAQNSATGIGRAAGTALERAHLRAANLDVLDPHVNGEFALLRRLAARFPAHSVFDVGANVGKWSIAAAAAFPAATIHSFEPAPGTFEILEQSLRTKGLGSPRICPVPLALAEAAGSRALHEYDESDLSSFVDWHGKPVVI